ncbi:MAG: AbrB/MazE/SpoVT family DNA-binding domain-containing protein [Deltaproteobacteria bacterium]|nr:AbrB/MazE/SpoVT family DNA-binding domain-containing protein [Deltaproteobacteria bacterium]
MPKVTVKGQITIPKQIRSKFGLVPGTDVDVVAQDNKVVLVKNVKQNSFLNWLGRGASKKKADVDRVVDKLRGRTDG